MKKRILAFVLTVLLLAGLSVISTSAVTSYNLWVGGVTVTSQNAKDVLGDGRVRFDAATNTLYLTNADIKGRVLSEDYLSAGVYAMNMDLTVSIAGNSRITDVGGCNWSMGIGVDAGNLIIKETTSDATLTVYSAFADMYSVGLYAFSDLEDVTIGGDVITKGGNLTVDYKGNKLTSGHSMAVCTYDMEITNGTVLSVTGAPSSEGNSYGINACGDVSVSGSGTVLRAKGGEAAESHGLYVISLYEENENGEYVVVNEGDLQIKSGAKVYAQGSQADFFSAGVNVEGGVVCASDAGLLEATGGNTNTTVAKDEDTPNSRSYGITSYGNLVFEGGTVTATAGYAYDSCGINALTETEYNTEEDTYIPLNGDVTINGAKVSAVSEGGYAYSDGLYVGGDLEVKGGSLTASGSVADAKDKDLITESNGIFANYGVNFTGGTITLSCKNLANGSDASCAIFSFEPIVLGEGMVVTGSNVKFIEGDTQIVPEDFDVPVVIAKEVNADLGDVNADGDINIKDATAIQKHIAEIEILTGEAYALADFNCDDTVSIKDATAIQKHIAGLPY